VKTKRKEVKKMKKIIALLSNLFLSSTLFWGVPPVEADELVIKEAANLSFYCHMQFPEMRADTPSWDRPVLDETAGNVINLYGPCDDDAAGADEIRVQRRVLMHGFYGDGK
jgi:hypothetical protein